MNYSQLKKLDEETLEKLTEGTGPSDKCLCSILAPPEEEKKKGFKASIKRAFGSLGGKQGGKQGGLFGEKQGGERKPVHGQNRTVRGQNRVEVPLSSFTRGGKGFYTTKEVVKRKDSCGKCGCDNENIVLKHSFANIRISSPDISSICPCPSCLEDRLADELKNNITVTIEHVYDVESDPDISEESYTMSETSRGTAREVQSMRSESMVDSMVSEAKNDEDEGLRNKD